MDPAGLNGRLLEMVGGDRFADVRRMSEEHQAGHGCGLHNAGGPVMATVASIARSTGAQRVLDLGSGLGYSTLWLADAVGPSGHVTGIDADPAHTDLAWNIAAERGFGDRVRFVTGTVADVLSTLHGRYDLIHDDAWFADEPAHLDAAIGLLRPGGTMTMANWFLLFDSLTGSQQQKWERFAGPGWQRRTQAFADRLADRSDLAVHWITSPPVGMATKRDGPSVVLDAPLPAISFRRTPEQVADVVLSWQRPDRPFFAAGACHVLARQFVTRHPEFRIVLMRPRSGHNGSHVFATDGSRAFDFNGWSTEAGLVRANIEANCLETPDWAHDMVPLVGDFEQFCRQNDLRTPALYPGDVVRRADRYIDLLSSTTGSG